MSIFRQSAIKAAMRIASADLGCHDHFMEATKSATDTFRQNGTGRLLAMLADLALTKHASGSFEQQLYHKLSRQEHWTPQMDELVEPVAEFLATCKQANVGAAVAPAKIMQTLGGGASKGSEGLLGLFTTAMLASTALGSGMGALNWHMKRQVNEDDAGNEEMSAKADFMRDMAEQIRRDARLRKWRGAATSGA